MHNHIILTAFGTTTLAQQTYHRLQELIAPRFPGCMIHWAFSSPKVRKNLSRQQAAASVSEIISTLKDPGKIVIQSLHILPGYEFHRIVSESRLLEKETAIGRPLLDQPEDFTRAAAALKRLISHTEHDAVLVLGHGTDHPCRFLFHQLELEIRRQVGPQVFFTTIEKHLEPAEQTIKKIVASGHRRVFCIPFLMVAGMHFLRDIIGDSGDSWKSRFQQRQIAIDAHDQGIALLDGISSIFSDHIDQAFESLNR
jgi:sirohydrochlorin cobaltochelatase